MVYVMLVKCKGIGNCSRTLAPQEDVTGSVAHTRYLTAAAARAQLSPISAAHVLSDVVKDCIYRFPAEIISNMFHI